MGQNLADFSLATLIDLDSEGMWLKTLHEVYGVSDAATALYYARQANLLELDLQEQILCMLNLLPVSAVLRNDSSSDTSPVNLVSNLSPIMDQIPLDKARSLARSSEVSRIPPDPLAFENWKGIRSMQHMGKEYFGTQHRDVNSEGVEVSSLENKRLIVAYAKEVGVLLGPNIVSKVKSEKPGQQILPSGWVFFGPKIDLDPGIYTFDVSIEFNSPRAELIFDVVANGGINKILELKTVGSIDVSLIFEVSRHHKKIEFRCVNPSKVEITCNIKRVTFSRH